MEPIYSLAYLTSAPLSPPDAISLAARLGYDTVGLRITPAAPGGDFSPLMEDRDLLRETVARAKSAGISVFDVEIVRLAADFRVGQFDRFLETCGELGAKAILVAGDDPDEGRLTDSFAAFCAAARPYGLTADLEFMPWTKVPDARTALRIVTRAGQENGGVLVDALHAGRSTTTLDDLLAIPAERLHYAQICDGLADVPKTHERLIYDARCARLLPGEGGIDLVGIFSALPPDLPISVEIPHDQRKAVVGVERWSQDALLATRKVLAGRTDRRALRRPAARPGLGSSSP
jgi:sugar phosphate isomerase/epimerase